MLASERQDVLKSILLHGTLFVGLMYFTRLMHPSDGLTFPKGNSEIIELSLDRKTRISAPAVLNRPKIVSQSGDGPAQKTEQAPPSSGSSAETTYGRSDGIEVNERERYFLELRAWIEQHKIYPPISRKFNESGSVLVRFNLTRAGKIEKVEIATPTSYARLNQAAVKLLEELPAFKSFPASVTGEVVALEVPVHYSLQ